jgi:hypothetical protein
MKLKTKTNLTITTAILALSMTTGAAWAQHPVVIRNQPSPKPAAPSAKPAAGSPAPPAGARTPAAPARIVAAPAPPLARARVAPPAPRITPRPVIAAKEPVRHGVVNALIPAPPATAAATKPADPAKPDEKKWSMTGKRDPFFSPVVQQSSGSGCSTGKKCLEIGQINVRGVVKSEAGFIAVVTNGLNKAYFLHENDPVFNGYVMKITGDTVVFQETVQDKLGKPETHEVVKRILTPAV